MVSSPAAPKWLLIADDDPRIRAVWSAALTGAGYRVLTAENGLVALDLLRTVVPDLVLLDLRMPEISGPAFLRALQGSPVLQRIPVLIVSGFLQDDEPTGSAGLNIVGRLAKPVTLGELLEAVRAVLRSARNPL